MAILAMLGVMFGLLNIEVFILFGLEYGKKHGK